MSVKKAEVLRGPLESPSRIRRPECVFVALVIEHAKHMHPIVESYVTCLAIQYPSTLFKKRHYFQKNGIDHKICVMIFSTTFV